MSGPGEHAEDQTDRPLPAAGDLDRPIARLQPAAAPGGQFAPPPENFYAAVGGHETFAALVREFYRCVADDDLLRPMYPEADLGPAERRLLLFLEQYWGGPRTYLEERGHPRLRMRHAPFTITPQARDRWLELMRSALDTLELPPLQDATLWDYLERAAHSMVNSAG